jgi:hypothetical protein
MHQQEGDEGIAVLWGEARRRRVGASVTIGASRLL